MSNMEKVYIIFSIYYYYFIKIHYILSMLYESKYN